MHLNRVLVTAALGLLIGLTAMAYQLISGRSFTQVLFSGQDALPELVAHAADYSLAVLILLIVCKAFAYGLSLSAFRGGPVFPSMFIGAATGIAASALPGMDLAAGIAMGIGAMCAAMLRLPLTSTLLAVLLHGSRRRGSDTSGRRRSGRRLCHQQRPAGSECTNSGAAGYGPGAGSGRRRSGLHLADKCLAAISVRFCIGLLYRLLLPPVLDRVNDDPGADPHDNDAGDHLPRHQGSGPLARGGDVAESNCGENGDGEVQRIGTRQCLAEIAR